MVCLCSCCGNLIIRKLLMRAKLHCISVTLKTRMFDIASKTHVIFCVPLEFLNLISSEYESISE